MNRYATLFICLPLLAVTANGATTAESPYAGQEARSIKSLSDEEIRGLLSGSGMGLAKAAELNGYPGPAHVLELGSELKLTPEQRAATEALFASMQSKAARLGAALVAEERRLDELFRERSVTSDSLAAQLTKIGALQAEVRGAHLEAHLAELRILTPAQTAKYASLRGYTVQPGEHDTTHHQHEMIHN
jgi:Spy/CpxP family protein refolding chaperone